LQSRRVSRIGSEEQAAVTGVIRFVAVHLLAGERAREAS
jgi:hypothetical protein